jgi:hypothetical protein
MTPGTNWIDQAERLVETLRGSLPAAAPADAQPHGSDCRWCPVCQVAAVVRGERPEVTAALADVLTAAATALRTVAAAGERSAAPAEDAPVPPASDPVQRIDIA